MTRRSWIQCPDTGELIPKEEYQSSSDAGYYVIGDLQPYKSMCDGTIVEGRRQHREHLRRHGVVEVGDAFDKPMQKKLESPRGLKETLIEVFNSKT